MTLAVLVMIAFVILFVFMLWNVGDSNDLKWTREVYLFGSAEAIVFAAVGWVFGSEVHRARADAAEERAATEEEKSRETSDRLGKAESEAAELRAKGSAVASLIRSLPDDEPQNHYTPDETLLGDAGVGTTNGVSGQMIKTLKQMANELFPCEGREG